MKKVLQTAVDQIIDVNGIDGTSKEELIKLGDELRKANPNEVGRYIFEALYNKIEEALRDLEYGS